MILENQLQFRYADLLEEGADLYIHDPKVSFKQIEIDLGIKQKIPGDKNKSIHIPFVKGIGFS